MGEENVYALLLTTTVANIHFQCFIRWRSFSWGDEEEEEEEVLEKGRERKRARVS